MFDINEYKNRLKEAIDFLQNNINPIPKILIVLGTGLGELTNEIDIKNSFLYNSIPYFPVSTVKSHKGRLVWGTIEGKEILVLEGRFHLYEGYSPEEIAFPIRSLAMAGVECLIITNAAGGLNPRYRVGDIMLITDHINMTGENPLCGPHDDSWGPRFPDMSSVYNVDLQELSLRLALSLGIRIEKGVYIGIKGPSLETPAETRVFRMMGADAIGMSTIQEVITAVQAGMQVLGFSVISNVNLPDCMEPTSIDGVIRAAQEAGGRLKRLIRAIIKEL